MVELWHTLAAASGRKLDAEQVEQLDTYLELLVEANERMNLTRITSMEDARIMHVADALTLLPYIAADTQVLVDVGSGGGVPGIPLAVALPNVSIVLIESTGKKAAFLQTCARDLGLINVQVRNCRAEDAGLPGSNLRGKADVVTARAVAAMAFLVEWCVPLLRVGGKFIAQKGPKLTEELPDALRAIRLLNSAQPVIHPVTTLPGALNHVVCEIRKIGTTNEKYPRPATVAKGKSL